ncbi:MAG: GNAT family N-acetyltransferase [Microthrixaceae bacterium]
MGPADLVIGARDRWRLPASPCSQGRGLGEDCRVAVPADQRVRIRPWGVEDAPALAVLFHDPLVYRFTPIQPPFDEAAARRRIDVGARGELAERLCFRAIVVDGVPAGEVAAYRRDNDDVPVEAGISFVVGAAFRGTGVARRAVSLMIEELSRMWSGARLVADIATDNEPSHAVARSLGFTPDLIATPSLRRGKDYETIPWVLTI